MGSFPLLPRKKNTDKSRYGHALVLAGSKRMPGAAILAARAALASGAGLVTLGVPECLLGVVPRALPEAMPLALPQTSSGSFSLSAARLVLDFIQKRKIKALLIGPGLSTHPETARFARRLIQETPAPVVLDADGLNSFKGKASLLRKHAAPLVLTPHRGEFERLFGQKCPEKESARLALAKKLSKFYDVVLVLKGHRTLVVKAEAAYVNRTGNPGMAKGGSGDVLAGMIAAFIAQDLGTWEAAKWAVYYHGLAGDIAVKKKGELGLLASDLIADLPKAFRKKSSRL